MEPITYKSVPRFGHLVLHVDEVQVVVDAAAKAAVLRSLLPTNPFHGLGHLVLHVDEVQVVVDAAAKVAPTNHYLGLGT